MEDHIHVVDAGVGFIDEVTEVDSEDLSLVLDEERAIPSDVFLHRPDDAVWPRLGGAAAEKLDAVEPDAEDAIELSSSAGGFELEDDLGEFLRGAVRGECVVGENRGFAVGEGELVVEDVVRARWLRRIGEDGRLFDLEVASW